MQKNERINNIYIFSMLTETILSYGHPLVPRCW